jgi:hypothetical protein
MTEGDAADKLSATHQYALVVRIAVEDSGEVTGELVDPISEKRRRFTDIATLVDEIRGWIEHVVGKTIEDAQHSAD